MILNCAKSICMILLFIMAVSYKKLWKVLIDKEMKKTDLIKEAGITSNILARMGNNQYIALDSLEKICVALKCDIGDVVEFVNERNI